MAHDVFISHSTKDKTVADATCAFLEAKNIRCWIAPRDILPGADWGTSIIEAIAGGRIMVLILSSSANSSPQIKRELERAIHRGMIVIPMRIEDVLPGRDLEYFLGTPHWLDAFDGSMEEHLEYLASTINKLLSRPDDSSIPQPSPRPSPKPRPLPWWRKDPVGLGLGAVAVIAILLLLAIVLRQLVGGLSTKSTTPALAANPGGAWPPPSTTPNNGAPAAPQGAPPSGPSAAENSGAGPSDFFKAGQFHLFMTYTGYLKAYSPEDLRAKFASGRQIFVKTGATPKVLANYDQVTNILLSLPLQASTRTWTDAQNKSFFGGVVIDWTAVKEWLGPQTAPSDFYYYLGRGTMMVGRFKPDELTAGDLNLAAVQPTYRTTLGDFSAFTKQPQLFTTLSTPVQNAITAIARYNEIAVDPMGTGISRNDVNAIQQQAAIILDAADNDTLTR